MSRQPSEDTTGPAPCPAHAEALRAGCNEVEAALAWACARFGGQDAVARGLDEAAAAQLTRTLARLDAQAEDAPERARLVATWEALDHDHDAPERALSRTPQPAQQRLAASLKPRWLTAAQHLSARRAETPQARACAQLLFGPLRASTHHLRPALIAADDPARFDVGALLALGPHEITHTAQRLGALALADLLRPRDRRQIASVLKTLPDHLRAWILDDLRRADATLPPRALARAQEVFLTLREHHAQWDMRLGHLGLYLLAASAGRRHSARLDHLAARLPPELGADLLRYGRMSRLSSRGLIDEALCLALGPLHDTLRPPAHTTPTPGRTP